MAPQPSVPAATPTAEQFESTEAYAEALAERKAEELLAKREAAKQQSEILDAYHEKEEEARTKHGHGEVLLRLRLGPAAAWLPESPTRTGSPSG